MTLIDIALFIALTTLTLYILVIVNVIPHTLGNVDVYHFSYILLIIAIFLFIMWTIIRFCMCCTRTQSRTNHLVEVV